VASIFHQNMRTYAGGEGRANFPFAHCTRNQIFDIAFRAIAATTGHCYVVAGFTEIMNDRSAARNIKLRALALDPGLTESIVVGVGTTALTGQDEYIAIAWDPDRFDVRNAGRVVYNETQHKWECHNLSDPLPSTFPLPNPSDLPSNDKRAFDIETATDIRGIAYVHGTCCGEEDCVFAFMHNMHTVGDRGTAFYALDTMIKCIHSTLRRPTTLDVVGGDFNLEPPSSLGSRRQLKVRAATYKDPDRDRTFYERTTYSHTYDYWFTNQTIAPPITNDDAHVHKVTLYSSATDHAAIRLTL
jgi:hypothetical protein